MTQVQLTTVLIMGTFVEIGEMLEASVKPKECICPDEGYSCKVALAREITWMTESNLKFDYSLTDLNSCCPVCLLNNDPVQVSSVPFTSRLVTNRSDV